jgi:WD40 repeat protein
MPQDFPTSEVLATFRDPIGSLAYSQFNDRSMLAIGTNSQDDPSIRLWDLEERRELHRLRGHTQSINGLSFNAEGNLLLSGSSDRTVRVWDILTGQEKMLLRGHQESVRSVAFSPTQPFAVSGDLQQNLHLWTLAPQREETFELPVTSAIDSATLSPDGKRLAVGEKSGLIRVWSRVAEVETSIPTQQELLLKGHRSRVIRLDFSPDGNSLASASLDGEVRIWDLQRKATVNKDGIAELIDARPPMKSPGPPRGIFLLKDRLILGGETGLKVIQLPGSEVKELPIEGKFLRAVALSGDNQKLATTDGRFLQFWNLNTLEQECTKLVTALQPREIVSLAFESLVLDPNRPAQPGWRLVTAYETGKAHFWDVLPVVTPEGTEPPKEKLQVSESHELFGHGERIDTLAFARNGKTLVTGSRDRTIKFWDPLTGADRGTLTGHTNGVVLVTFLPNQRALLTVGREGMAKLWKLD